MGESVGGCQDVRRGNNFGAPDLEGEQILEFYDVMSMVVGNTLFKKKRKHLITYESGGMVSQTDYILVRKEDRN